MKKKQLLLLALTGTVCMTGCFDKYTTELSADEAKTICQAIIDNSKREDFELPTQYGIDAWVIYDRGGDKSDVKGKLVINKEKTFIYLDAYVKEGEATDYTHSLYFLFDDAENNLYKEGIDKDGEKKLNLLDKSTMTADEAFDRAKEKVSTRGKDWVVQSSVLQLLVNELLIDAYIKGLHIAENLPDLSFIKQAKEIGLSDYECSMVSDGEMNIDVRYKFTIGDIDTDITASWKDGYLYEGDIYAKDGEGYSKGNVSQVSIDPFVPDTTDYTEYRL